MKISRRDYEEAYLLGRKVYSNDIRLTDAVGTLVRKGVNRNSATALVSNLTKMLDGQGYVVSLAAPVFDDYLSWIYRDYGQPAFGNAVSTVERHIKEYEGRRKTTLNSLAKAVEKHRKLVGSEFVGFISPEEIKSGEKIFEGRIKAVMVNVYERSPKARTACIEQHGDRCVVCNFNFGTTYGAIGKGFIHVHHLKDLASIGGAYQIDPIQDLRPVCPNCHAMLHKKIRRIRFWSLRK